MRRLSGPVLERVQQKNELYQLQECVLELKKEENMPTLSRIS